MTEWQQDIDHCHRCGGAADVSQGRSYFVECLDCGHQGGFVEPSGNDLMNTVRAILKWNREQRLTSGRTLPW